MPEYLSPGVYVEEVPSAVKPIAGVSTSTAAFIGVVPNTFQMIEENPDFDPTRQETDEAGKFKAADGSDKQADRPNPRVFTWTFPYGQAKDAAPEEQKKWQAAQDAFAKVWDANARPPRVVPGTKPEDFKAAQKEFLRGSARAAMGPLAEIGTPVLCTSFEDFKSNFLDFSLDANQNRLAHAVFGFFNNGGTRAYVMRYATIEDVKNPENWEPLEAIDEISLVAAPVGDPDPDPGKKATTNLIVQNNLIDHCEKLMSRFAIIDAPELPSPGQGQRGPDLTETNIKVPDRNTDYGALYFPWVQVFDMPAQLNNPDTNGEVFVGPCGHMAGIYSRVDHERGVHKAPANEVVRGALDIEHQISKNVQDGLNPYGVNCIRFINDNIRVWGARTIGGDANADLKYINVRRVLIFLRESIDRGTQWVVFEPNDRALWAKIVRNISDFLTNVWRDGALFGSTPQEAFYVKCDDTLNPPEERDLGKVTTEIGVSIVRPAEFVIFRISQWAGPKSQ